MLNQEYTYYVFKTFIAGLPSIPGILGLIVLFLSVLVFLRLVKLPNSKLLSLLSLALAIALLTTAFYGGIYEFDEKPETLAVYEPADNEGECGKVWTNWHKGGYGIGNRCPMQCYRNITLRKQLRMSGFPPWPEYRRELQCALLEE